MQKLEKSVKSASGSRSYKICCPLFGLLINIILININVNININININVNIIIYINININGFMNVMGLMNVVGPSKKSLRSTIMIKYNGKNINLNENMKNVIFLKYLLSIGEA